MRRGHSTVPPSPGTSPIWTCGSAKTAFSPAKTRSQHRAMVQPRPMAGPCTTAIDGWGRLVSVRNTRAPMRATSSLSTSPSYIWRMKLMSPPAQNARPAPSRTRTRTAAELAMRSRASPRAWYRGQSMAFSCSGRSKVRTPTPVGVNSNRSPGRAGPMMSLVPTHFLSLMAAAESRALGHLEAEPGDVDHADVDGRPADVDGAGPGHGVRAAAGRPQEELGDVADREGQLEHSGGDRPGAAVHGIGHVDDLEQAVASGAEDRRPDGALTVRPAEQGRDLGAGHGHRGDPAEPEGRFQEVDEEVVIPRGDGGVVQPGRHRATPGRRRAGRP